MYVIRETYVIRYGGYILVVHVLLNLLHLVTQNDLSSHACTCVYKHSIWNQ